MSSFAIDDATVEGAEQSTPEVSTRELRQILRDRSAIVIDTRPRMQFEAGHIPGARDLDVPREAQIATIAEFVRGNRHSALVLYCNGPHCKSSRRLAEQLIAAGFGDVKRYQLGMAVWRALGGPTAIELGGIERIVATDRSAALIDARSAMSSRMAVCREHGVCRPTTRRRCRSRRFRYRTTISTGASCCSVATAPRRCNSLKS